MQPLGKKIVLVVEDNEEIAQLITDALELDAEYQVVVIHDGTLAIGAVRSIQASLILLDIELPGMDGLQIYDSLRSHDATSGIPVIFVTAKPNYPEFEKRNIKDCIKKPFDLDELLAHVAAATKSTNTHQ